MLFGVESLRSVIYRVFVCDYYAYRGLFSSVRVYNAAVGRGTSGWLVAVLGCGATIRLPTAAVQVLDPHETDVVGDLGVGAGAVDEGHRGGMGGVADGAWLLTSRFTSAFFFQAEDGIRDLTVTGVQTCALPI